jgi:hypothetical protein
MTQQRRRFKQSLSLNERLSLAAMDARRLAEQKQGAEREALLEKAREFEVQIALNQSIFGRAS